MSTQYSRTLLKTQKDAKIFSGFTSVANPQVSSYLIARFYFILFYLNLLGSRMKFGLSFFYRLSYGTWLLDSKLINRKKIEHTRSTQSKYP
jgi:hypothetical protein